MDRKKKHTQTPDSKEAAKARALLKIGELLIKEKLAKKEDIQKALSIQKWEKEMQKLPLGQILVKIGALSESDLEALLNHTDPRRDVGALAVQKGLITKGQLEFCLKKKQPNQLMGELLIAEGLITPGDLGGLLKGQIGAPRLGELAVRLKLISEKDVETAVRAQKSLRKLGEILCDLKLINPLDLNYVLKKYDKELDLGEIVLSLGYINNEQLNIVRQEQQYSAEFLGEILVRKKFITREKLQFVLSRQYNIPFKYFDGFAYAKQEKETLTSIISQRYAEKNLILPISLKANNLTLAVFRAQSTHIVYELRAMYIHFSVSCILITQQKFEELFELLYNKHLNNIISSNAKETGAYSSEVSLVKLNLDEEVEGKEGEGPLYGVQDIEAEELVNFIIKYGIINGASDIHIEQDRKGVTLRYRLDGVLRDTTTRWLKEKLKEKVHAVISRIKIVSGLDIAEKRLPQDGVFRVSYYDKEQGEKVDLDFRVATCRGIVGENVTIRILDSRKAKIGLESLNHSPHVLKPFKTLLRSSAGMILVCGPTGSGKSSTLYAALQYLYNPGIKIITAEDPIEYSFPGVMQTQIHPKINLSFSRLLRSFLRLDPDVILIGEMRDEETAKIGFDAAQTGHLLLSTLHTNDAISAVSRLLDLKVEYGQIASCLSSVLAQRLVRKICPSCIKECVPNDDEWGMLFDRYPSHLKFYRGVGCKACNFTGYKGRTLISEIFVVDVEIAHALNSRLDEDGIKKLAIESGMKTMLDDGLLKLQDTTLSEIIRVVPHDMIKVFRARNRARDRADFPVESGLSKGGGSNEGDVSPATFRVYNPETQTEMIDLMQAKYEALKAQKGDGSSTIDSLLFKEFITDSFYHICEKYRCKGVTFNIENKLKNIEISAIPNP
jgi:type II secretory ATPase GspE/PulE/Tfp pilus assembly ATPase PilB-like protein